PPVTPVNVFIGCTWQLVGVRQWCITTCQVNADAGSVPCCGSVAWPEKVTTSPTAHVNDAEGESMNAVGASLPAWIVTAFVSAAPNGSVTVSLAVKVPTG